MRRLFLALLIALAACAPGRAATWAYVTAFRSGAVYVVDATAERMIRAIPVEDRDGAIGLCATRDGSRLVIVDGDEQSRVRVFDALSGHVLAIAYFPARRLTVQGPPIARLSGDDASLFVQTRAGTRVFDMKRGTFRPRALAFPGCFGPAVAGGGVHAMLATCGQTAFSFSRVQSSRADFSVRARGRLEVARIADTIAMGDGTRLLALAQVPPMRALPPPPRPRPAPPAPPRVSAGDWAEAAEDAGAVHSRPAPPPAPNPSLKEGPWKMASWRPGDPHTRVINLVKQVDLEKVSASGLPRLAVSPDNRFIAIVYGRRAWVLHAETLLVQWEIYPPGIVDGAAFGPDSQELFTVLDGSLVRYRLANRSYRILVENQMRLSRPAMVVAAPRPVESKTTL